MEDNKDVKSINFSVATRKAQFKADSELVKQFDMSVVAAGKRFKISLVIFILLLALTIYNFVTGHFWIGVISSIITIISVLITLVIRGLALGAVYESGLLVPAVITNTNPVEVTVLSDVSATDDKSQLACKKIKLRTLPLHTISIGEKIPCVALFGGMSDGCYTNFDPRPLAWATANIEDITRNIGLIDNSEWDFLEIVKDKVPQMNSDQIAYFDENGNFQELK